MPETMLPRHIGGYYGHTALCGSSKSGNSDLSLPERMSPYSMARLIPLRPYNLISWTKFPTSGPVENTLNHVEIIALPWLEYSLLIYPLCTLSGWQVCHGFSFLIMDVIIYILLPTPCHSSFR